MKSMGLISIAFAAVTLACGGNDRADVGTNNTTANDTSVVGTAGDNQFSVSDRDFIEDMAAVGMAEIELGRLATERGQSAEVRRFGQMMADDHGRAGDELKQIASRYAFVPPAGLDEEHRELRDRLSRLQGAEFDREYMQAMVDGHQNVVDRLERRVDAGSRPTATSDDNPATVAVNQWAAKTLPTTRRHLEQARAINDQMAERRRSTN